MRCLQAYGIKCQAQKKTPKGVFFLGFGGAGVI